MFIFLIFISFSCAVKKNFHQTGQEYYSLCMSLYTGQDTVQLISNKVCIFENDTLKAIGEIKNGERKGDWYIYRHYPDIFECSKVIRYKKGDSTVVWSRGMINETW